VNEVRDASCATLSAEGTISDRIDAGRQPARSAELLESLRRTGVRICIDDFGTGYSYVGAGRAADDALKIDRSFVMESASQGSSRSVVEAIISIAHVLGKVTVAEGVETSDQVRTLRELGCDFAQGYFFAKPVPAEDLPAVVARIPAWRQTVADSVADHERPRAAAR
jgi:EAL domain-containing protein (putative c-di-GMP-specific phosphodiesterase class I)